VNSHCEFDIVGIFGHSAAVDSSGNISVGLSAIRAVSGTVSLVSAGGSSPHIAAATHTVYGTVRFRARHRGRLRIKVHLTASARKALAKNHHLKAAAVITLTDHGKKTSTAVPFTIT
jgi:hypothetical protein